MAGWKAEESDISKLYLSIDPEPRCTKMEIIAKSLHHGPKGGRAGVAEDRGKEEMIMVKR